MTSSGIEGRGEAKCHQRERRQFRTTPSPTIWREISTETEMIDKHILLETEMFDVHVVSYVSREFMDTIEIKEDFDDPKERAR